MAECDPKAHTYYTFLKSLVLHLCATISMTIYKYLLCLLTCLTGFTAYGQVFEAPPPKIDKRWEEAYLDSLRLHENSLLHYRAHQCRNRYGKYGWVDKHHKVVVPFEYDEFPRQLTDFNPAKKGKQWGAVDARGKIVIPIQYLIFNQLLKQKLVICGTGYYKKVVFDYKGKVVLPEQNYFDVRPFNDHSLAVVLDHKVPKTKIYNLQGELIKTWDYANIYDLRNGRLQVYYDTILVTNRVTYKGLIDTSGKVLMPMVYTEILWEKGDWVRVINHQTKVRGLFRISTQTFFPDKYYSVAPPDPLGNFTFLVGETMGAAKLGLMDEQFRIIYPAAYRNIQFLDEQGHYILTAGRGLRGYRCGVGNARGDMVVDTVWHDFAPVLFSKKDNTLDRNGYVEYDTSAFWTYNGGEWGKNGLWHRQLGQLQPPVYYRVEAVSHTTYTIDHNDTTRLYHVDGRLLACPYHTVRPLNKPPCPLLVHSYTVDAKGSDYLLMDPMGQVLKSLESEPRRLNDSIFVLTRYVDNPSGGYGTNKQYALFDAELNPITDFVYENQPEALEYLPREQTIRMLELSQPAGFGAWVAFYKTKDAGKVVLVDGKGKVFGLE